VDGFLLLDNSLPLFEDSALAREGSLDHLYEKKLPDAGTGCDWLT
jgi:hypothetical protein